MDLATDAVGLVEAPASRNVRGSTGDAIAERADSCVTRTMTRESSDEHPCTTSSANAVAYRAASDQGAPT